MVVGTMPSQTARTNNNIADTFWCKYILSVVAATIAELVTYPLDLTKTRLQVQGEKALPGHSVGTRVPIPYRGMMGTAVGIVREEGVLRLWQGMTPAIYRHLIYTGIRMETYEQLRDNVLMKSPDGSYSLWKAALGGLTAGAVGQLAASPADLVKVQLQMEGRRRLEGRPPRIEGGAHAAFRRILKEGGLRGLWKGWAPNVQRAALVNLGDLTTYDSAKRMLLTHTSLKDGPLLHTLSSACAGLVAATMGTPADVVKTRVMNQPTDARGRGLLYRSSVDCLRQTVQREGFWALYKGFLPTWIRMAPWSLTFWLSFEHIRRLVGAASF